MRCYFRQTEVMSFNANIQQAQPQPHQLRPPRPAASGFGKFMFWFQWVTPLITASMFVFGRGILFGQELGWSMFLLAVFVAPIWVLIHWIACALLFIPPYPRRALALPTVSGILNLATIPLTVMLSMFIEDATDHPDSTGYEAFARSALGMSDSAIAVGGTIAFFAVAACFIAYVVTGFIKPKSMRG